MALVLRKWVAIFAIYFQEGIAYRASGVIWVLTDVTTAATMPLVWASAAKNGLIAGFNTGDFVLYYLSLLLLQSFVTSHIMWDLAMEIREGQFSTALLRPISFYQLAFLRNLSWRVIRPVLFLPFFFVLLWLYRPYLGDAHLHVGGTFWIALVLGHLVSFTIVMALSMIALYTQEALAIFELYYVPMLFLSGALFPVAVLPNWARSLAQVLPFYYTTGAPTEILVGRLSGDAAMRAIAAQLGWIVVAYLVSKRLWSRGLRHYTGVGM